MTLQDIKEIFEKTSLQHKKVKTYDFGERYDASNAANGNWEYPLAFLELPYLQTWILPINQFKTLEFSFNILIKPAPDSISDDHQAISDCEMIGEAIITKIQNENHDIKFDSVTGLSLHKFSDDDTSGFRYDFKIRYSKEFCKPSSYEDEFNSVSE